MDKWIEFEKKLSERARGMLKVRHRTYEDTAGCLVEGYKNCPGSEGKSFEEVADWCGRHVVLGEEKAVDG